jgi:hypothetical protein
MDVIICKIKSEAERMIKEKLEAAFKEINGDISQVEKEVYQCSDLILYHYKRKIVLKVKLEIGSEIKLKIW